MKVLALMVKILIEFYFLFRVDVLGFWPGVFEGCECKSANKQYYRAGHIFLHSCPPEAEKFGCKTVKSKPSEQLFPPIKNKGNITRIYKYTFSKQALTYRKLVQNFKYDENDKNIVTCKEGYVACYSSPTNNTEKGQNQNPDLCLPKIDGGSYCPLTRVAISGKNPSKENFQLASEGEPWNIYLSTTRNFDGKKFIGFVNSLHIKEGVDCLNKFSFDKNSSNSYSLLKRMGYCHKSTIDFSVSEEQNSTKTLNFTEREIYQYNTVPTKNLHGFEVQDNLFYNARFGSDIQIKPKCHKYIPGLMAQKVERNKVAYYFSVCFLLLQIVPLLFAVIPELFNQDDHKKIKMKIDIPKAIDTINENYKKQNQFNSNRVWSILLFTVEMISGLMCIFLAQGFFKTKGMYLKYIALEGCFPEEINQYVLIAVEDSRQKLKAIFMLLIILLILFRASADLWRKRKFLKVEKEVSKWSDKYKRQKSDSSNPGDNYNSFSNDKESLPNLGVGIQESALQKPRGLTGISLDSSEDESISPKLSEKAQWGKKVMDAKERISKELA